MKAPLHVFMRVTVLQICSRYVVDFLGIIILAPSVKARGGRGPPVTKTSLGVTHTTGGAPQIASVERSQRGVKHGLQ
jgi:hypothetical protein